MAFVVVYICIPSKKKEKKADVGSISDLPFNQNTVCIWELNLSLQHCSASHILLLVSSVTVIRIIRPPMVLWWASRAGFLANCFISTDQQVGLGRYLVNLLAQQGQINFFSLRPHSQKIVTCLPRDFWRIICFNTQSATLRGMIFVPQLLLLWSVFLVPRHASAERTLRDNLSDLDRCTKIM